MQRIVKPKTQQGRRALEKKEPKIIENTKNTLFFKGGNTSNIVTQVLKEWHLLKKPYATMFSKKNTTRPFEDQSSVEFFTSKADSSLFMFGSHSKKRPNNIVIGRLFDGQVLDMVEFGVDKFISLHEIVGPKSATGIKPCLVFSGEFFEENDENKRIKNLLIDFFRGANAEKISLNGLEHVISVTAVSGQIYIRNYRVLKKKSGTRIPRVELEDMGPSLNLSIRRTRLASDDLFKRALKKAELAKAKKKKNISRDDLGNKLGRIHMSTQNFGKLQARKLKGLKRKPTKSADKDDLAENSSKKQKVDEEMSES
ncbi:ribosome production factor 2 [Biomphalaria glabrata]|uniref:Ribosome production factor 2 homolog n=1 Tax=Biomphalaria glabrata TaxID=6526 RepID=A0A9W3AP09_BIOGL|nr:ribosome production factor 2 homolog [Biomphalaria glabrata]KAI8742658.1 putative ribosome production factor 2 [Biomphalaria glabrata]